MLEYHPYALINLITGLASLFLALMIGRNRPGRGTLPFVVMVVGVAVWCITHAIEIAVTTLNMKIVFGTLNYLGIVVVPVAWFLFVVEYTGRDHWLSRRNIVLLSVIPALTLVSVGTNSLHGLHWANVELIAGTHAADYTYGVLFWGQAAYQYGLLLVSAVLLIRAIVRSPSLYQGQITGLLVAQALPWAANALYLFDLVAIPPGVDLTASAFALSSFVVGWSIYRYHLMDVTPIARHMVFNSMQDGVFVFDTQHRIVDANRAAFRLLQRSEDEVIGRHAGDVFNDEVLLNQIYQPSIDYTMYINEYTMPIKGENRYFDVRLGWVRSLTGVKTGRILTLYDITELVTINKALNEARIKADEASRLKSEFLAVMSHELRTPLNAILGYTSLLEMGVMGELDDDIQDVVRRMDESGNHLLRLINDVLDLAKIEAGRVELNVQAFNIQTTIEAWQYHMDGLAAEKSLTLEVWVDPALPDEVAGDPDRLSQIVINLLSNAVKFTDEGGITLRALRKSATEWCIQVEDTGIGIPPDAQPYIFEQFRQADSSSVRRYGGTGLGLTIVARLVELMNGSIQIESEVDKGSIFTITLPLKVTPAVKARSTKLKG